MRIIDCPVCDAEVVLDEDNKPGDTVFCGYCKCELRLIIKTIGDKEELSAEYEEEY